MTITKRYFSMKKFEAHLMQINQVLDTSKEALQYTCNTTIREYHSWLLLTSSRS